MNTDDNESTEDEYIGYGCPPTSGQFKKGQSGNPKGRPKVVKNSSELMQIELRKKITLKENGKPVQKTKAELLITSMVNDAIKGKPKALDLVYKLMDSSIRPEEFEITEGEEFLLQSMLALQPDTNGDSSNE